MTKFNIFRREWLFVIQIKNLPLAGKFYLSFSAISLVLVAALNLICSQRGTSLQTDGVRIIFTFLTIYFIILPVGIIMKSRYQQDRNVIASVIPGMMAIMGILLALYFRSQQLALELNFVSYILFSAAWFMPPVTSVFLRRSLSIQPLKLYISSWLVITISGLINYVFLVYDLWRPI